jgi:TonB-linked SusC/RagA family outer membrane protein
VEVKSSTEQQQTKKITGTITDATGEALIGASVSIKGKSIGTVTDNDGNFTLNANVGDILEIAYIGYIPQTVTVSNQANYAVSLSENAALLNEVVVIGYGTLEKKQVTSSITSISAAELPAGVGGVTIANALSGKVSNLVIQETPSPNTGTTLQLRGMASVNASQGPLVVIDGMPGGDIRSVVLEDIKSIDILKDASAGAIYGTRATGGVILITTKQAQEGKMKLSYTGEAIFKNTFGKPRVMNAQEFMQYIPSANNYGSDVDWYDAALADNPISNRQVVSLQGGVHDAKIYATVVYEDNKGSLIGDNRKDLSGRLNGQFRAIDGWLDINTHLAYRQADHNQSNPGIPITANPTHDPFNPDQWETGTGSSVGERNPITDAQMKTDKMLETWFRPDVELKLNILPIEGLSYSQVLGYEKLQKDYQLYEPSYIPLGEWINRSGKGTAEIKYERTDLMNIDGYFSFVRQLSEDHYFNASLGYSYFEKNGESYSMRNYGFSVDGVGVWDMASGTYLKNTSDPRPEMASNKKITERLLAYFARAHYSFKDRYILSATLRHEGSSKFAVNNRWGNFWQTSAAWRLSKENFMANIEKIKDLKLRVAYGVTGNEGYDANYAATLYAADSYSALLPDGTWAPSYGISRNVNPDLKWEEKHEFNIGLDYELFDGRLWGKVDYFRRKVDGLIYEVNVPSPPYVYSTMFKNIGTLENTGWEFEVGGNILHNKDWNWDSKITIGHNATKVGKMADIGDKIGGSGVGRAGLIHRLEEGNTVGSFLLYKYVGLDAAGRFIVETKDGATVTPEADGLNDNDKSYIGNYVPAAVIGWSHDVSYKNWFLQMQINSAIKFDIYNSFEHEFGTQNGNPAGNQNKLLSAFTTNADIKGQTQATDFFLEDGTYLKIQNLSIGYRLNTKQYLKVLNSAKIYLTINNVLRLTKYSGLNPEIDFTGWNGGIESAGAYPQTRTFALGLQLNF